MCTAASDVWDRSQGLASASHAALCFTDLPLSDSLTRLHFDYFAPQPDIGPPFLSPETYPSERWQTSPPQVLASMQATLIGSDLYTHTPVCSASGPTLSDATTCVPLQSSSTQQFYFSPMPLDHSIPSQVPNPSTFTPYQTDKPLTDSTQDASQLFLPHDSPADFSSVTGSSTEEHQFNQFNLPDSSIPQDQWLSLPTSTPSSTYPLSTSSTTDYLTTSPSPCLPLASPAMSTTTTSPTPSTFTLDYHPFHQSPSFPNPLSSTPTPADLSNYGIPFADGTWRCAHPGCTSSAVFRRGCDLRKHFNRHRKYLFCRHEGCPQATQGGFSNKKDRARHEAKHNPGIRCEWDGCGRVFSRVDNMKDHVRRIHKRREGR